MAAYVDTDDIYMRLYDEEDIRNKIALIDKRSEWIKNTLIRDLQTIATAAKRRGLLLIEQEIEELIETNLLRIAKMDGIKARYRADIETLREMPKTYAPGMVTAMRGRRKVTRLKPELILKKAAGKIGGRIPRL